MYGEAATEESNVHRWMKKFKEVEIEDELHNGNPLIANKSFSKLDETIGFKNDLNESTLVMTILNRMNK